MKTGFEEHGPRLITGLSRAISWANRGQDVGGEGSKACFPKVKLRFLRGFLMVAGARTETSAPLPVPFPTSFSLVVS